jgi:hypothetical protein
MARSNESAVQRIQVGVLGLLAVLVFVYIANLIVERAAPMSAPETAANRQVGAEPDAPKDEPLAELGVTPAVEETKEPQGPANAQPTP